MQFTTFPRATGTWLLLAAIAIAQNIYPSNSSTDLYPASSTPRFLLNGTEFRNIPTIHLAPLGEYAQLSHDSFLSVKVDGQLVNVNTANANIEGPLDQFSYISCDPSAYSGNLNADQLLSIVVNQPRAYIVILYSETSGHCSATGLQNLPPINGILTTTNPTVASMVANLNLNFNSNNGAATILPDLNSFTNSSSNPSWNDGTLNQSPTTAVAMIILYSITGIITALFVVIIVTGAIRAHRHPERYGPRNIIGRGRQSRAKGIARAMLETLPIVKFGDRETEQQKEPSAENRDIEMNSTSTNPEHTASKAVPVATSAVPDEKSDPGSPTTQDSPAATNNPDGTDAEGHLGCSICTEDFTKGEEVRVLPCNHKFHPDCVDPWLLNVSGTCPLCRIDLRPQEEDDTIRTSSGASGEDGQIPPPPLAGGTEASPETGRRRDTFASLRQMANLGVGSREERIAALRRLRQDRGGRNDNNVNEAETAERRGRTRRFRERFRIRTERNEPESAVT